MVSLINKQLLLTAYAYLFIMEQQKAQQGGEALQLQVNDAKPELVSAVGETMPYPAGNTQINNGASLMSGLSNLGTDDLIELARQQLGNQQQMAQQKASGAMPEQQPTLEPDETQAAKAVASHLSGEAWKGKYMSTKRVKWVDGKMYPLTKGDPEPLLERVDLIKIGFFDLGLEAGKLNKAADWIFRQRTGEQQQLLQYKKALLAVIEAREDKSYKKEEVTLELATDILGLEKAVLLKAEEIPGAINRLCVGH